jgi:hypothetical protein
VIAPYLTTTEPPQRRKRRRCSRRLVTKALKMLKALRSVAQGGVTYRDYTPRVSDAQIIVDRYVQEPERGDAEIKGAIAESMRLYGLAGSAWNARISQRNYSFGADPAIARCEPAQRLIAHSKQSGGKFGWELWATPFGEGEKIGILLTPI